MKSIVIDEEIVQGFQNALTESVAFSKALMQGYDAMRKQADDNRLMGIQEACTYLGGINEDTLLYYRKLGLSGYKKGREGVWYRKGDIDDWLESGRINRQTKIKP